MPIPDIQLDNIRIREIGIPDVPRWMTSEPPQAIPIYPPVTSEVGTPIVNIPGCVEAHKENDKNTGLKEEDPEGVMTLCDAGTPSFSPMFLSFSLCASTHPGMFTMGVPTSDVTGG